MESQLQNAITFFKSNRAYHKLFKQFRKKYESIGRVGGTVPVNLFTKEELEELASFFAVTSAKLKQKRTISLSAFEQQIEATRFAGVDLKMVLDAYFKETILSKKEQRQQEIDTVRQFLTTLKNQHPCLGFWLERLLSAKGEGRWLIQMAYQNPEQMKEHVRHLAQAWGAMPTGAELLPMFSERVADDPHAFDLHTDLGKMFLHMLTVARLETIKNTSVKEKTESFVSNTEQINELLQSYHIYRDDLLNFVTCAGFLAETDTGVHSVWQAASKERTVQIVPLRELTDLKLIYPAEGGNKVWIVENSGVCSTLLNHVPNIPIVCTNGQFTLAALLLMDRLVDAGCTLLYAGDFDPEGLGMAQRLLKRYPAGIVHLWHMDNETYEFSAPSKSISQERLEKLNNITHENLLCLAENMRQVGKAGYQESLVQNMVNDLHFQYGI